MIRYRHKPFSPSRGLLIVGIIWLAGAACDRLWFTLDQSVPAWDQADYLNGALNYWQALQTPHLFNSEWWRSLWLLSTKISPLTYILTVPFFNLLGLSLDAATWVMQLYSALLLVAIYGLGIALFNIPTGLWAAGLCLVMPGLYRYRTEYLLDFPLTAIVTFTFWLLTLWKINGSWLLALAFGLALGIALLVKQTALLFLLIPIVWVLGIALRYRKWQRLVQLISALGLAALVAYPWYRTNWLLILTSGKRATLDSAIAEGDPPLHTLDAWTYYGSVLPYLLSWVLLIVPVVGFIFYWIRTREFTLSRLFKDSRDRAGSWRWLAVFLVGGYLLSSININKDARYILPLLPVLSLLLAVGLLCWKVRYQHYIRWGTVGLACLLMGLNLFPVGGQGITQILSPRVQHPPYLGKEWPHQEVVQEILTTSPYLQSTLGVLPSTPAINQHNFSFYGGQFNFQVVGRQVGIRPEEVEQDARSLDWFLLKTGDQGSVPEAQAAIVERVENGADFRLQQRWELPDRSTLKLYYRTQPSVEVKPLARSQNQVRLERVIVPKASPPNVPVPITYVWSGSWDNLQSGLVLLTWHRQELGRLNTSPPTSYWLHDRAIGMGALHSGYATPNQPQAAFRVTERTAMFPSVEPGEYTLKATYLNRQTGKTYPIAIPFVTLTIDPDAVATPAPELDLVTQLRELAPGMATGIKGLEPIFVQTARINQYDPVQDYLAQTEQTLVHRLEDGYPQRLDWVYAIALARVLQQDVEGAISAFKQVIKLDSQNPYSYTYLAFVYLYNWQPHQAQAALRSALVLAPNIPEIRTLSGIAALMQGNLIKAWRNLSPLLNYT